MSHSTTLSGDYQLPHPNRKLMGKAVEIPKTIFKYPIVADFAPHAYAFKWPEKIVEVALQGFAPHVWVLGGNEKAADRHVTLQFFPTGGDIPNYWSFIKTVHFTNGLVGHLHIDTRDFDGKNNIAH